jgi:hypothetical protein
MSEADPNALDGNWYDTMAPESEENSARREMLSGYETQDAFFDAHHAAVNTDWRAGIAGDDTKFLSKLGRFTDPAQFGNAYREAEQKIRAGDIGPTVPGEGATDEEIAAYRTEAGIPLEAAGYLENLPEGLVVGENDKELMLDFMGALHSANAPPEIGHKAIEWYTGFEERMQTAQLESDTQDAKDTTDALRESWGSDYRTNMNLINGLLKSTFGDEASELLTNGRFADGKGFFNSTEIMTGFANLARLANPVAPLIPNDQTAVAGLHDEIAQIEKYMSTKRSEYNKDEPAQARLRELYGIRLKLEESNAA